MKIYVDEIKLSFTPRAIWLTIICLRVFFLGLMRELWMDVKFYKYEIYIPDWEEEREIFFKEHGYERLEMDKQGSDVEKA